MKKNQTAKSIAWWTVRLAVITLLVQVGTSAHERGDYPELMSPSVSISMKDLNSATELVNSEAKNNTGPIFVTGDSVLLSL